ncbi:MAG: anion permease [Proteobacteria bacterium]|nr:anion permease [Pseudomonadota bacterium]
MTHPAKDHKQSPQDEHSLNIIPLLICVALGLAGWFCPAPEGMSLQGWHLLNIFVVTILALIIKPLPMGAVAMISVVVAVLTKTITMKQAFGGFSSDVVWLVVFALFIAKGFNVTGLDRRIAYFFTALLGKKTLGLSYGLMVTDLILAPALPSVTGRSAGIVYPILQGIATSYKSFPHSESARKIGAFLTVTAFQVTVITSTMFMTAMAANPILHKLTNDASIPLTWGNWAQAAIVPGLVSLIIIPWFIYKIYPPEIKETPNAQTIALAELKALGKMRRGEWIMAFTVFTLLFLWIFGKQKIFGFQMEVEVVIAAMVGLTILLVTGVLDWKSLVRLHDAWETFVWFCVLIMLAGFLKDYGVLDWFTKDVQTHFAGLHWTYAFPILALIYFYSHYFFASSTAHVTSMYPAFLGLSLALGTPPMLAVFILIFFSNLFGGLTHYSLAPAPLLFGVGYVDIKTWWKIGFLSSVINIIIWSTIGLMWWKFLGFW